MDLKQAEYMIKISETKNITKAAELLFLTQPALNQQLTRLEKELGAQIFFRSRANWHLTPAGEIYLKWAKEMIRLKNDAYNQIQDVVNSKKGHLSIGFTPNRGSAMFSDLYHTFHDLYPELAVNPIELNVYQQQELIHSGDLDLGFVTMADDKNAYNNYIELCDEEILFAVSKEKAKAYNMYDKDFVTIDDLRIFKDEPFILIFKKSSFRPIIEDIFSKAGFKPNILFETSVPLTITKMINNSTGCGIIPKYHKHKDNRNIKYYSFSPVITWKYAAVYRKGSYLSQPARDFIELAREYVMHETR